MWPSYQTIADATGKSVKTIQRAVRELEVKGWLKLQRGNGVGHNTEYRLSAASTLRASDAREKADKIVTLYPNEGGQIRPARPRQELRDELFFQRAVQVYLSGLPAVNMLAIRDGSEAKFGPGYNILPTWKKRMESVPSGPFGKGAFVKVSQRDSCAAADEANIPARDATIN